MSRRSLVAVFEREEDLLLAVKALRAEGHEIENAYTPYPVHGLDEAMGLRPSRLPYVTLAAGLLGLVLAIWFQVWTSAIDWPLDVGGKPRNSLPAFVPIAFEVTVLLGGLATAAVFFLRGGRSGLRPAPAEGLADDRFALVIGEGPVPYRLAELGARLTKEHAAVEVFDRLDESEDRR